jgi:hypothetical protein
VHELEFFCVFRGNLPPPLGTNNVGVKNNYIKNSCTRPINLDSNLKYADCVKNNANTDANTGANNNDD